MIKNEYSIIEIVADLTDCYENALPGSPQKNSKVTLEMTLSVAQDFLFLNSKVPICHFRLTL